MSSSAETWTVVAVGGAGDDAGGSASGGGAAAAPAMDGVAGATTRDATFEEGSDLGATLELNGVAGAAGAAATGDSDAGEGPRPLVHPGGFFTQADLGRIRANVAAGMEPAASAWAAVRNSGAGANYQPNVTPTITNVYAMQNQGHAAYQLAVKWIASGDTEFATACKRIIDAWVNTVTLIDVDPLRTGIGANLMANAAEIMAHGFDGAAAWPPLQVTNAQKWFGDVVWPRIGMANAQRSSNWGTAAMAGGMATAVFADDLTKYNYIVEAYKNGFQDAPDGCSGVTQYICNASGQTTEAGRDQGHPQAGVAHLVEVALMAWNQGLDLVTFADHRVVAGMEYLAKYNLGNDDVPYDPLFPDPCDVHPPWTTISTMGRGVFLPVWEMANRFFDQANIPHPFTARVVETFNYQPEGTLTDLPGLGTLTAH